MFPLILGVCLGIALLAPPLSTGNDLTPLEQLGKELFFDRISNRPSQSCATCHTPSVGWTGRVAGINLHGAVYRGAMPQRFGNRKPPTSAYAPFAPLFTFDAATEEFSGGVLWDGRATGEVLGNPAADQALGPFLVPVEQNMPGKQAVCEEVADSRYAALFEEVWGPGSLDCSETGYDQVYDRIGLSIAAYEASPEVSPFSSKFDVYWDDCLAAGNDMEDCGKAEGPREVLDPNGWLTDLEWDGLIEFGEYCSPCHVSHVASNGTPPLFTDFGFENIGVPRNPDNPFYRMDRILLDGGDPINPEGEAWVDLGLGTFLRTRAEWEPYADENDGKFRIPTLRNVDQRPGKGFPKAYMHNGALKSLEEVVHFYNTRDVPSEGWDPPEVAQNVNRDLLEGVPLGNLELDAHAEAALVAFLGTLSDGWTPPRDSRPTGAALDARPLAAGRGILLHLPESGPVEVRVYDVAGRLIRDLGVRVLPAGEHVLAWDGTGDRGETVASGIYFHRVRAGQRLTTVRTAILR
jgi:cytochrome c peroxidase